MTSTALLDPAATAIANEARRRMLDRLAAGPATVTELAEILGISGPAVLRHLDRLTEGGLVTRTKSGRSVTVEIVPGSLDALVMWATSTRLFWSNHLDRFAAHMNSTTSGKDRS
ncbi:metalloregulator ArsR/SmtB family transcription factor [Ruania suaedae]|uniref:ArsR/SmtB family transcription factor n=1 Tax=Ruania suaedae TaxID=2897774 RepID=UPI001E2CD22D|nr:metalloregulator ArsR/SmtB family transcription factor [Ruania suaedae]UFU01948.1 metalloregulator ArsR/SmtB family transcription factor [Ruania suaedae]